MTEPLQNPQQLPEPFIEIVMALGADYGRTVAPCGCVIEVRHRTSTVFLCPMHAAAQNTQFALMMLVKAIEWTGWNIDDERWKMPLREARKAIAAAKGEG